MLTEKEERVEKEAVGEEERSRELSVEETYHEVPWLVSSPPGTGTKINTGSGLERLKVSQYVCMASLLILHIPFCSVSVDDQVLTPLSSSVCLSSDW